MDIVSLLGADNPLVRTVLDCERRMLNSLSGDERKLAARAGIADLAPEGRPRLEKYQGTAFNLVFEADLPDDHDEYWCAELLINENVDDADSIPVVVSDWEDKPIKAGKLRFFGLELTVCEGNASCTLLQLREQLSKPIVVFALPGSRGVRGHLKLW